MNSQLHDQLKGHIWEIANRLRGPYRPPQYRLVMLPIVVLRRLDCVLEPTKDAVLKEYKKLVSQDMPENAMDKLLGKAADPKRMHPLYNTSRFTFDRLLGDSENIAPNLVSYINGFSPTARAIFERFKFNDQIEKLDASNRLFTIVKAMADVDLHPDRIDNLQMGYLFEHLVMRFNEQANEEAGDHFTPREVIRLMANLIYTGEQDVYKPGIYRTIYDPACGTGGMLSESEKFILDQNSQANLALYGQEYNDESWAICCSDMLIKDEDTSSIVLADTLGDGKTGDGFEGRQFHYLLANPPFGVEWKDQKVVVEKEHKELGFSGRFGAGLPAINDGSLLFLQHMISKMHPYKDGDENAVGSKIAIVFNGSPLFSGDAGSGPSNIRRWIIENDWLDAVVAMPDQLFYNTGIYTYVWLVTNRKAPERRGKVQLIDGTRFFQRMKKSLNNKRNEISEEQIRDLTRIYGDYQDGDTAEVMVDGNRETRVVSRIFENREFGFLKVTVERPLRLSFEATAERIARLEDQTAFANLATSKKRKDKAAAAKEVETGKELQASIRILLATLEGKGRYTDRARFDVDMKAAAKQADVTIPATVKKAIFAALGERDPEAEICRNAKGMPEPDSELRDTENIPLPEDASLPLPMLFGPKKPNDNLVATFTPVIDKYIEREVLPHVPDAWVDYVKTKVGYEIPINRHFYVYKPPRPLDEIESNITALEGEIAGLLKRAFPVTAAKWDTWKLAHAYPRIGSGTTPTSTNDRYYSDEDGLAWVTTAELRETYIEKTATCVTEEALRDFSALRIYDAGSLMIAMYGATIGRLGITAVPATCNQACCVFENSEQFHNRFLFYWLWHRRNDLIALSTGGGQPNLSQQDFREELAVCPPLNTQKQIARFLDQKTEQIDGLIEKKRALLDRLAEKRQALITLAVTKGLNPDAPMKPSGIDWLGDIPAHWEMKRLRFLARLHSGSTPTTTVPEYWDGDIPWISPKDVKADELFTSMDKITSYAIDDYRIRLHEQDNAVIVIRGMILARKVPVAIARGRYTINQDLKVIESKGEVYPEFFQMYLSSINSFLFTLVAESGHGTKALRTDVLSDTPFLVPPIDDQRQIIQELEGHKKSTNRTIAKIYASVEKLVEYRAALISSAVTGQMAELL